MRNENEENLWRVSWGIEPTNRPLRFHVGCGYSQASIYFDDAEKAAKFTVLLREACPENGVVNIRMESVH